MFKNETRKEVAVKPNKERGSSKPKKEKGCDKTEKGTAKAERE